MSLNSNFIMSLRDVPSNLLRTEILDCPQTFSLSQQLLYEGGYGPDVHIFIKEFILFPKNLRLSFYTFLHSFLIYKLNVSWLYEEIEEYMCKIINDRPKSYSTIADLPIQLQWGISPNEASQTFWTFFWTLEFIQTLKIAGGWRLLDESSASDLRIFINSSFQDKGEYVCYHVDACLKLLLKFLTKFIEDVREQPIFRSLRTLNTDTF